MSRNYKFHNRDGVYFVSFAVVEWIDAFTRNEYKDILVDSLSFCQREKGMEIFAWCIMTNHVHLVFRSINGQKPELLLGDLKRFTSKAIVNAIRENPRESRKEWLLERFKQAGAESSNVKDYQFWQHNSKPIELWSNKVIFEKISYIHNNPVEEGLVNYPQDYVYSSAKDYAGEQGLLKGVIVARSSFCCRKSHTRGLVRQRGGLDDMFILKPQPMVFFGVEQQELTQNSLLQQSLTLMETQ